MKRETLLEKAKAYNVRNNKAIVPTDEILEVALAWLKGEIQPAQVAYALGLKLEAGNYQRHIAGLLREAYKKGKLKIV